MLSCGFVHNEWLMQCYVYLVVNNDIISRRTLAKSCVAALPITLALWVFSSYTVPPTGLHHVLGRLQASHMLAWAGFCRVQYWHDHAAPPLLSTEEGPAAPGMEKRGGWGPSAMGERATRKESEEEMKYEAAGRVRVKYLRQPWWAVPHETTSSVSSSSLHSLCSVPWWPCTALADEAMERR